MPRVRYKPWTLYEETFGLKGVKKITGSILTMMTMNSLLMLMLYTKYGKSRHIDGTPEENARLNKKFEDDFDRITQSGNRAIEAKIAANPYKQSRKGTPPPLPL